MPSDNSHRPQLHRDGTITDLSHTENRWIERVIYLPAEEIAALPAGEQARVRRHLKLEG